MYHYCHKYVLQALNEVHCCDKRIPQVNSFHEKDALMMMVIRYTFSFFL